MTHNQLKKCSRCKKNKSLATFCKSKTGKYGRHCYCRECLKEYHREHRTKYPEKHQQWQDAWNHSEPGKRACNRYDATHREQRRAYHKRHQAEARGRISAYRLNKLHTDPEYYFKQRIRQCIRDSVGRLGLKKSKRTENIVGLSFSDFKKYLLETWENNYGYTWAGEPYHIDHIIPLATAKTENDVIKLCHYTNLQMLTPEDNRKKGCKYDA